MAIDVDKLIAACREYGRADKALQRACDNEEWGRVEKHLDGKDNLSDKHHKAHEALRRLCRRLVK
jgi:hypothetical protein